MTPKDGRHVMLKALLRDVRYLATHLEEQSYERQQSRVDRIVKYFRDEIEENENA